MSATITITVNVAAANKWEGDAEVRIQFSDSTLPHIRPDSFNKELTELIEQALAKFQEKNA